jgi:predicted deacetylase
VDALGNVPMTWLVVPDFHRRNPLHQAPSFCRLLDERLANGDELALHGYAMPTKAGTAQPHRLLHAAHLHP